MAVAREDNGITSQVREAKGGFMYECFHFLARAASWDADFDFSDFGYEGEGIVQMFHCNNCGAEIEYRIPCPPVEEENLKGESK